MDFEVQRCTRRCHSTQRELEPDEVFFSVLVSEGTNVVRRDFCADAWEGPLEGSLGWWKSRMPSRNAKRLHWAPNDIMLEYFEELADQPDKQDVRYVLTLLLIRRRVVRLEDTEQDKTGREQLVVYCARREKTYHVHVVLPDERRADEIQDELAQLLFADAA
jgi:hypothetical protein